MKIVEQLVEALARQAAADAEVQRLVKEVERKLDGRGKRGADRKPRKKRVVNTSE